MPYLANQKWELFCHEWVELTLQGDADALKLPKRGDPKARLKAYERAGLGVPGSASNESNARRMSNRPVVRARFQELFRERCEYRDITAIKLVTRIDRVGRVNIAEAYEDDGRTLKNLKAMPREVSDAIESIKYVEDGTDEEGNPRYRAEIKLFDKNAANFTLLKHFGGLPEPAPAPVNNVMNFFNGLSLDDQLVLLGMLEAVDHGQGRADRAVTIEHQPGPANP